MFRPQPISSTDARRHFTQIINKVSFSSKSFVIRGYRKPLVRVVNEKYIRALEEVVGKNIVNQIMQVAGNERLREAEKAEQIKKIFQRLLTPPPKQSDEQGSSIPRNNKQKPKPPNPQTQNKGEKRGGGVLLLKEGKNYV